MMKADKSTVLLIDDAPEIHALASHHLKSIGLPVLYAHNGIHGLEMASEHKPDLILLDYNMPDLDGLSLLRILKASTRLNTIPVILVTAAEDQNLITNAFNSGAVDYVPKPFNGTELKARVTSALKTRELIRDLQSAAETDALTGLLNLHTLSNRINAHCRASTSGRELCASYYIDLDNFKIINDTLGHSVGDRMIVETARRLRSTLLGRLNSDGPEEPFEIARVGGDEFVVFVPAFASVDRVIQLANDLLTSLNQHYQCGDRHFYSSASIGIHHEAVGSVQAEKAIMQADIALYAAKAAGKRCWRIFDAEMKSRFERRVTLENDLRKACETMDFHLVYQPIVRFQNDQVDCVEALIRWDHCELGVIEPRTFVPIAQSAGLLDQVGEWCMNIAFEQLARWRREDPQHSPSSLCLNVTRQQLLDSLFVRRTLDCAKASKLLPRQIQLEISETEAMLDIDFSIEAMKELRRAGFRIAIDDFGTGYSSLACLDRLPVDTLKIDQSIIADLGQRHFSSKLVELVMKLADETGLTVVAEGVESLAQEELLRGWNCQYGQGFRLARPMSAETMIAFIRQRYSNPSTAKNRCSLDGLSN